MGIVPQRKTGSNHIFAFVEPDAACVDSGSSAHPPPRPSPTRGEGEEDPPPQPSPTRGEGAFFSLPPCGGGLGWGVTSRNHSDGLCSPSLTRWLGSASCFANDGSGCTEETGSHFSPIRAVAVS